MTANVLVTGVLFRAAETRTSRNGNTFTVATVRSKNGEQTEWWKVISFSESAQNELSRLVDGDALSMQGTLKAEIFEKDGVSRVSLGITADNVLALRQPPRTREKKTTERPPDTRTRAERCAGIADPDLSDDLPF